MEAKQPAFSRWAGNGFARELVFLTPFDDPGTSPGKRPVEPGWQTKIVTPGDLIRWSDTHGNVGLRAKLFPAIDIDVDDQGVADLIARVAVELLGDSCQDAREQPPPASPVPPRGQALREGDPRVHLA